VVPSLLQVLLADADGAYPYHPEMRVSVAGGTITQSQIDGAKARIAPHIYNSLSSTESHIIAYTRLDTPDDHRWQVPAVGAQVEVVDEAGRPTAIGETGALRVGTKGAPNGYLNDPETSAAFFRDGFFYTGDLAQRRTDGRFALMGRSTDVINLGGHKVSPAPIEDRLRESLGASGVCLLTMQDGVGEEQLFVLVECAAPVPSETLATALRAESLPFGQARVRFVPALPRNAMGKLMRRAARDLISA
jgi:acyl-coenzyme A synthetase/AMP-(fatty) acid ligase